MTRRSRHALASSALMALAVSVPAQAHQAGAAMPWTFHADHVLGTSLDVTVVAGNADEAGKAAEAALAEIRRLDAVFGRRRPDSELTALNRGGDGAVSADLGAVLARAAYWRATTGGAFDERLGVLDDVLGAGAGTTAVPGANGVETVSPVGVAKGSYALDGIAKGAIIDAALAAARDACPGAAGLLVDIGGDLRCWGSGPDGGPWRIGIAAPGDDADNVGPSEIVALEQGAVATSGRSARDRRVAGQMLSHLIDPRTGVPQARILSATVIASRAVDADALSTAFTVMAPEESVRLAQALPDVATSIVLNDGTRHVSEGWMRHAQPIGKPRVHLAQLEQGRGWPRGHSLAISYEVPAIGGSRYRRPYIAVWVTNASGERVRTIELLGRRPGWQRGNYLWTRTYAAQSPDMVDAVSRPTRSPGRYTARWDGLDDRGRPVAQGAYTIHVEAARQFGGHSYASTQMTLTDRPSEGAIRGRDEFGSVRLTYGPGR